MTATILQFPERPPMDDLKNHEAVARWADANKLSVAVFHTDCGEPYFSITGRRFGDDAGLLGYQRGWYALDGQGRVLVQRASLDDALAALVA